MLGGAWCGSQQSWPHQAPTVLCVQGLASVGSIPQPVESHAHCFKITSVSWCCWQYHWLCYCQSLEVRLHSPSQKNGDCGEGSQTSMIFTHLTFAQLYYGTGWKNALKWKKSFFNMTFQYSDGTYALHYVLGLGSIVSLYTF